MAGKTDFTRVDDEDELRRQAADDPDLRAIPSGWYNHAALETGIPAPPSERNKRQVTMRLDPEIIEFFKAQGRGWQTRVNAVLKAYVDGRTQP